MSICFHHKWLRTSCYQGEIKNIFSYIKSFSRSFTMISSMQKKTLLLSSYTFSKDGNKVGEIVMNTKIGLKQMRLSGADAELFSIEDEQILYLKEEFNKAGAVYEIAIEAECEGEKVEGDFRIIRDEFKRNKVIAHRGAWKNSHAPENSLASLDHAIKLGCEGSEFDVHLSSDSVLFVYHDAEFQGYVLETTSSDVLSSLLLENGERLPSLEAFLQNGIAQNQTRLIIEIKPSLVSKERSLYTTSCVLQLVKELKAQAWVDYISFDYDVCLAIRKADPYVKVAYLDGDKGPMELSKDNIPGFDYNFEVLRKNENWINEASVLNLNTNAWTVDDEVTMRWLLEQGIDYITTNEPELLLTVTGN